MKAKNISLTALAAICAITMIGSLNSCSNDIIDDIIIPDPNQTFQIIFEAQGTTYILKPFTEWTSNLTDIENYMSNNYPTWSDEFDGDLVPDTYTTGIWNRSFRQGNMHNVYLFADKKGVDYKLVAYNFYGSTYIKTIQKQLTDFGYVYKGKLKTDIIEAKECHLYLSEDGATEVQVTTWETEGGRWSLSFQPFDENDLQYLLND